MSGFTGILESRQPPRAIGAYSISAISKSYQYIVMWRNKMM